MQEKSRFKIVITKQIATGSRCKMIAEKGLTFRQKLLLSKLDLCRKYTLATDTDAACELPACSEQPGLAPWC